MTARRLGLAAAIAIAAAVAALYALRWPPFAARDAVDTAAPAAAVPSAAPPDAAPATSAAVPAASTDAGAAASAGAPPTAGAQAGDTAAGRAPGGAVVYRIDAARSEARYEVGETFFDGNRFVVAVGRTKGVTGDIRIEPANPAQSEVGEIVVDVQQLTSDRPRRDNFIRRNALMSNAFPQARFVGRAIEGFPADPQRDTPLSFRLSGDLTVKDVTLPTTWAVTATVGADTLTGTATTTVRMSDYGIGPIEIAMLATEDAVKLALDFVAAPVAE